MFWHMILLYKRESNHLFCQNFWLLILLCIGFREVVKTKSGSWSGWPQVSTPPHIFFLTERVIFSDLYFLWYCKDLREVEGWDRFHNSQSMLRAATSKCQCKEPNLGWEILKEMCLGNYVPNCASVMVYQIPIKLIWYIHILAFILNDI